MKLLGSAVIKNNQSHYTQITKMEPGAYMWLLKLNRSKTHSVKQLKWLPSAVPEKTSALKLLVLFFRRCFLRLACGDGGGSILGLVVLDILGLEQTESPRPVSTAERKRERENNTQNSKREVSVYRTYKPIQPLKNQPRSQ